MTVQLRGGELRAINPGNEESKSKATKNGEILMLNMFQKRKGQASASAALTQSFFPYLTRETET